MKYQNPVNFSNFISIIMIIFNFYENISSTYFNFAVILLKKIMALVLTQILIYHDDNFVFPDQTSFDKSGLFNCTLEQNNYAICVN